jgi:hypothetical protein
MRTIKVALKSVTHYMQHRMDDQKLDQWEKSRGAILENNGIADELEKKAMYHSYVNKEGDFYIPAEHFKQCFIKGGGTVKGKVGNQTKSMKNVVAGQWRILENGYSIPKFDEVDSRSAVNKIVKARIMVHRPKWHNWECTVTMELDEEHKSRLHIDTITDIIKNSGRYLGIGSYRPEHTGEFGRFEIVSIADLT